MRAVSDSPGSFKLLVWLCLAVSAAGCGDDSPPPPPPTSSAQWTQQREQLDETVWRDERLAGEYEATLVALWDALLANRDDDRGTLEVLTSIDFGSLTLGTSARIENLDHDIQRHSFDAPTEVLEPSDWARWLQALSNQGYRLVQSEWHHAGFSPAAAGRPAQSTVSIVLHVVDGHVVDGPGKRRFIVEGELVVAWSEIRDERGHPMPEAIDATGLTMLTRVGLPAFRQIFGYSARQADGESLSTLHPILLSDLDRDGYVDIVSIGARRVLWNLGTRGFRDSDLLDSAYRLAETGVIADLNGDTRLDLLAARARGDLVLFLGDEKGRFTGDPVEVVDLAAPLRGPSVLTVGDIDGDADLDVWLAQYKPPYLDGQMPTPYYDANDGHPAHLLVNDGTGQLTDVTEASGLADKRFRRTYASSFVDLDDDRDLDLVVVSDFAGIDLYHNDGHGNFVDANHTLNSDRHLFGMSSSFADFDLDGRLDFFVAGMASTTARRLEALGLGRDDHPEMQAMRMRMAFGNRMYLAGEAGWSEPEFSRDIARTGWTWGTTALDFDNDGDPDLFAANGHESGESTSDYCTNFWTHDIFDGNSTADESLANLFGEAIAPLNEGSQSWDGYQKNHLLMNRDGRGFVDVAFLFGVADEFDSRSALSVDIDRDGRMDLVVVEDRGEQGERLHIYRNQLETNHHWIGVELRDEFEALSPIGASVTVRTPGRTYVGRVMTGETLMGQHAPTVHFGLGDENRVDSIEVRWMSGATRIVRDPEIDRYHWVRAGTQAPVAAGAR